MSRTQRLRTEILSFLSEVGEAISFIFLMRNDSRMSAKALETLDELRKC